VDTSEKLIKAWPIVKWLDDARWNIGASGSLIPGHIFASLEPSSQILTHWLCYITDQRRPWQGVWSDGGPVFAEDYIEACLVLPDSPKASAALSRRCLQHLLREEAKVKPGNLADEIQQVMDSQTLPSHVAEVVDAVRNVGNFAAHPLKSQKSGEILPVEPAEAEWNLDVLEALFDFYFVQPAVIKKKRAALDEKLRESGQKPMK